MAHIMIDIETLGTEPGCVVTQIVAVPFFVDGEKFEPVGKFEAHIDFSTWGDEFHINPNTLKWWSGQDQDVFMKSLQGTQDARDALHGLSAFMNYNKDGNFFVWAKSPDFDLAILEYCFKEFEIKLPWTFRECRDVRTIEDLVPVDDRVKPIIPHDPLSDAEAQAHNVWLGLQRAK